MEDDIKPDEWVILRLQFRTQILFQYLGWDSYYRRIGTVLLQAPPGNGTTIHSISRLTRIPRRTVRRKLTVMVGSKVVQKDADGLYSHTEFGRMIHIATWRDIMEIARGARVGLAPATIRALQKMPETEGFDFNFIRNVKFDRDSDFKIVGVSG